VVVYFLFSAADCSFSVANSCVRRFSLFSSRMSLKLKAIQKYFSLRWCLEIKGSEPCCDIIQNRFCESMEDSGKCSL
jgi:hypothetical protein